MLRAIRGCGFGDRTPLTLGDVRICRVPLFVSLRNQVFFRYLRGILLLLIVLFKLALFPFRLRREFGETLSHFLNLL